MTFYIPYQMLQTSLIRKHMYSYISENNFVPSNQIIVPTGYNTIDIQSPTCFGFIECHFQGIHRAVKFVPFELVRHVRQY